MISTGFRVGTRGSQLAMTQSGYTAKSVGDASGLTPELITVRTEGDVLSGPLSQIGGTGVFATALRTRVVNGDVDMAVHSLKDLPTAPAAGLFIAAIPEREDPRDALCARDGLKLDQLPAGSRVGTGSPRRVAQLRALRSDLEIVDIRGNVGTRLNRVGPGDLDAVVLAASGLKRLGRDDEITEYLEPERMLPAPGQGALAVEVSLARDPHSRLACGLAVIDHLPTRLAVTAERAVLAGLEAGCSAPVGAYGRMVGNRLRLDVVVAHPEGEDTIRVNDETPDPSAYDAQALGERVAQTLLSQGALTFTRLTL